MYAILHRRFLSAMIAGILILQMPVATAAVLFRTVALTGTHPTATPDGAAFGTFSLPVLNSAGRTAFAARLRMTNGINSSNDAGIWSEGSGMLALVAREGGHAPDTSFDANFGDFFDTGPLVLDALGHTAFQAALQTNGGSVRSTSDAGVWSERTGVLSLVAREGNTAPGIPGGAYFDHFSFSIGADLLGRSTFWAFLPTTISGVTSSSDSGIWSERPGYLTLVAREGNHAPGTPIGANFDSFGRPVINPSGQVAFSATLQLAAITSGSDAGIWSQGSGVLALVAQRGSHAPDTPLGYNFGSFRDPVINASGRTAFRASLLFGTVTSSYMGIWSEGSDRLHLVALSGEQAPGTQIGTRFDGFYDPVLNASNQTAFRAVLKIDGDVTSSNDDGVWSEGSGALALIAREGSQAPGVPGGAVFNNLFSDPVMNSSGRVAFRAVLQSGITGISPSNNEGIWAEDALGKLTLVVREGDAVEVTPGDFRTVNSFAFSTGAASGGQDGRAIVFNDNYTLAFQATFTDGTSGIFTATLTAVPEPATFALLCIAAMFVPRRWRANSAK